MGDWGEPDDGQIHHNFYRPSNSMPGATSRGGKVRASEKQMGQKASDAISQTPRLNMDRTSAKGNLNARCFVSGAMHLLALMIFLYAEPGTSSSGGSSSSSASTTTPRDENAEATGGEVSGLLKTLIQKVEGQVVALERMTWQLSAFKTEFAKITEGIVTLCVSRISMCSSQIRCVN
jgi:hypothetical protein